MSGVVDVIFLDIDGVLLPFGGARDNYCKDDLSFSAGCIFPDNTMHALQTLLQQMNDISLDGTAGRQKIKGNPALVLSSTWRARPEFVEDILSSFRAYAGEKEPANVWTNHVDSFFDTTDPNFHATRHDEIYRWIENNAQEGEQGTQHTNVVARKKIVRSWIALDDEDLVHFEGKVSQDAMEHAVQTKSSIGLTLDDVHAAVQMVKKQMQEFHEGSSSRP